MSPIQAGLTVLPILENIFDNLVCARRPSTILGEALDKQSGVPRPWGYDARHIVPFKSEWAKGIREKFADWGVNLNSADNGVYLPGYRLIGSNAPEDYHPGFDSNKAYRDQILEDFRYVTNAQEAQEVLDKVRSGLRDRSYTGSQKVPDKLK